MESVAAAVVLEVVKEVVGAAEVEEVSEVVDVMVEEEAEVV